MLTSTRSTPTVVDIKPRSFAALMDLYEYNYLRLKRIAPDLGIADHMVSVSPGHLDLYLDVTERCKFTTMLRMTYKFDGQGGQILAPDMHIKIYHDARNAEVIDRLDRKHRRVYSGQTLKDKWRLNRFLYKWLGYCIHQKHYFHPISQPSNYRSAVVTPTSV